MNNRKPIEQLLAELEGKEYVPIEQDASSNDLDDELEAYIRKSQARQELIDTIGDRAYDYDDPESALEHVSRKTSQERLTADGFEQDLNPSYTNMPIEHVFDNMSPDQLDEIPKDHKRAIVDPRSLIDEPVDITKPRKVAKKQQLKARPSFTWNTQKLLAASFRAQGYSAERIANFVQTNIENVEEWLQNPIFQARVNADIENGPELAQQLGKAHAPLVMRKLIALTMSGTDAHKTQVQAIAQFFKVLGMDGKQAAKKGVDAGDKRINDAFKFIEGVEYTTEFDENGEPIYDSAIETVNRDIGAENLAAFIQAKDIARQDDARLLGQNITDTDIQPESQSLVGDSVEGMMDFVRALNCERWDDFEATVVYAMTQQEKEVENGQEITPEQLAELRLEDPDNQMFAELLRQKIREATWTPILKLDPSMNTELKKRKALEMREYRARKKMRTNGTTMTLMR